MRKNGTAFIQQIVNTELDTAFDHPAKGTIVMIYDIVYKEGVVELQRWIWI